MARNEIDNLDGGRIQLRQCANRASPTRGKGSIPPVFVLRRPLPFFQPGISGTPANMKGGLVTPSKFLPLHSSFESIRKQAKKLARQFAAADADALTRVHAQLPAPALPLSLRDAQLVLAREHGFAGWQDLRAAVLRLEGK